MVMIRPIPPGTRYGRLVVTATGPRMPFGGQVRSTLICDCDCGATGVLRQRDTIIRGHTKSCGCLSREHGVPRPQYEERRRAIVKLCKRLVELERQVSVLRSEAAVLRAENEVLRSCADRLGVSG